MKRKITKEKGIMRGDVYTMTSNEQDFLALDLLVDYVARELGWSYGAVRSSCPSSTSFNDSGEQITRISV